MGSGSVVDYDYNVIVIMAERVVPRFHGVEIKPFPMQSNRVGRTAVLVINDENRPIGQITRGHS